MTYFGYAERQAADQLDWSVVRRETDAILNKAIERDQAKRADIEKVSKDYVQQLESMDMSSDMSLNEWWLDAAASGSQAMLQLNKDLKDKRISYRDYIKKRQNLLDATGNMQNMVKEMGGFFEKAKEAYNSGKADEQTMYEMSLMEGYSKFANTKWVINPTDYSGMLGKIKFNPETGVNDIIDIESISSLGNRLKSIVAPVDVKQEIQSGVKVLGDRVNVLKSRGVLTFESIRQDKEFQKAADNFVNSLMVNTRQAGQVLTNYVKVNPETGVTYEFTIDPKDKDPNKILLVRDPDNPNSGNLVPQLTNEQEKVAKDALMSELIIQLSEKQTPTPIFAPTGQTKGKDGRGGIPDGFFSNVGILYHGTGGQGAIESAVEYFKTLPITARGRVHSIQRTPQAVTVTFSDPSTNEISPDRMSVSLVDSQGKPLTQEAFIQNMSNLMFGTMDVKEALRRDPTYTPGVPLDQETYAEASVERIIKSFGEYTNPTTKKNPKTEFSKKTDTYTSYVSANNARKEAENIRIALNYFPNSKLIEGMTITPNTDGYYKSSRDIKVTIPSIGQTFTINIGTDNVDERIGAIEKIWETLSGVESTSVPQATPKPTQANKGTIKEGNIK